MNKAIIIILLIAFTLPAEARFLEGASPKGKSTVVDSSWSSSFKSWAKKKIKVINAKIKEDYGVDVVREVRIRIDDDYAKRVAQQEEVERKKREKLALEKKRLEEQKKTVEELTNTLPSYTAQETQDSLESVENLKAKVQSATVLTTATAGRSADPSLKKNKAGVPYLSLYENKKQNLKSGQTKTLRIKIKDLPKLDVGLEPKLGRSDFQVDGVNIQSPDYKTAKRLPSASSVSKVEIGKWLNKKLKLVGGPKKLKFKDYGLNKVVTMEMVEKLSPELKAEIQLTNKEVIKLSKNDLKMLSALLLYRKDGSCHAVVGIFHDLSRTPGYAEEANFHLGSCSHEMGFYSESTKRLAEVISKEDEYYTPKALEILTKHLPREYEVDVAKAIKGMKNKKLIPEGIIDEVNFILSRAASRSRKFSEAKRYAELVSTKSKKYAQAQFIKGVAEYASGQLKNSISTLKNARKFMESNSIDDKNLESLIAVDLGRIYFKLKDYKSSHEEYLKVNKDHPLWVSALIEQGWAQLMLGDSSGAIGNMYSLHSPYFKAVFMPESYAVRTIGYLNICQYGDAYQTLKLMEAKYGQWYAQVRSYINNNKSSSRYYSTLRKYLSGNSSKNVDGLPYQAIREIARRRNFLNLQDSLNQKADELAQFNFINNYIKSDKAKSRSRMRLAKSRMASYKNKKKQFLKKNGSVSVIRNLRTKFEYEKRILADNRFKLAVLEQSRQGFLRLKKKVTKRLSTESRTLKSKASLALKHNLKQIKGEMNTVIANNEFLRYEVFAGSGENIRFLAAGGKSTGENRLPSSIEPKKALTWSVTGEYWEDEIGNYRSALKNNCPQRNNYGLPPTGAKASARSK